MTLIIDVDVRAALGPVRDQGQRPTCLAFASSDVHRHARHHSEPFCVEWLYYHVARHARTGPAEGTTIPDTRVVLRAQGQPEEAAWPYSMALPDPTRWRPPAATPSLWTCESAGCGDDLEHVRDRVEQERPVVVGLFMSDTFNFPQTWEFAGSEVILGSDRGYAIDRARGHAVVVVGRGTYFGEPVMLLRNSWGPRWGHHGHAWVRENYLEPRLAGAFIALRGRDDVQPDGSDTDAHAGARLG